MSSIIPVLERVGSAIASYNFLSDSLDIITVALVIFGGIRFLRNSRSFELVKAIGFLAVVFVVVKLLNMEASEFILTTLFKNALIILVVLFAPEIRKMLEKFGSYSIGKIPIFNFNNGIDYEKNVTDSVNSFCKAAGDMSETKTGALVVFENKSRLHEIAQTGVLIEAKSSSELFKSIFFKNSALHDGAVVVRGGKIYSAGCILPLTQNTSLASDLGTRHRAAIGMSEQCDAVVVVVSEETGIISVAQNGQLVRNVTSAALREMLLDVLVNSTKNEKIDTKKSKKGEKSNEENKS